MPFLLAERARSECVHLGQGASLGEEAVLADSGRVGGVVAGVGWVSMLRAIEDQPGYP